MAKKKERPPIVNGLDDTYIVEKSRPLMLMKEVPFALGELKVLDTYLSRINARDPEATTVRFSKEEYENLMGIERMHPKRLDKYVTALQGKVAKVPDAAAHNGWRNYNLFDETGFEQDENGQWWIDLCCTQKAKKLFFNIEGVGYIRYQLKNVLPLMSKYSILLYIYLLDNRFRKSWEVSVEELRTRVLQCSAERYKEYKFFNQEILKKAITEVNEKTDLTFEYRPVRQGRPVVRIYFNLVKDEVILPKSSVPAVSQLSPSADEEPEQIDLLAELEQQDIEFREEREDICSGFEEKIFDEFTSDQLKELKELANPNVSSDDVQRYNNDLQNMLQAKQYAISDYIRRKILLCNASRKPVPNRYSFIKKAVIEDWK